MWNNESRRGRKQRPTRSDWILLALGAIGLIFLMGCSTTSQRVFPIKPIIKPIVQQDGGVCFNKADSASLLLYIRELEGWR